MTDRPLVSVVIPAYNHAPYVARSIQSVLEQTYELVELVVVDDGSTDGTWAVIEQMREAHSNRFQAFRKENEGVSATLNYGIQRTEGELVAVLASDDWYALDKIERQVALFGASPSEVGLIHASAYNVFEDGNVVDVTGTYRPAQGACFKELLAIEAGVVAPSVMFRREAYEAVGGFDVSMVAEDVDFYVGVAAAGYHFAYDPTPLVFKRVTGHNLGAQPSLWFDVHHRSLEKHADRLSDEERMAMNCAIYRGLGRQAAGIGDFKLALHAYRQLASASSSLRAFVEFGGVAARHLVLRVMPEPVRHALRTARSRLVRRRSTTPALQ